ncbi:uncharacterized protein TM35_000043980 [Trypanosoma theileri]|uniref:Uncharacterized protein n=1 Tax=Trypanosoma theileri TaxID=67003 RepID=A0A1X0P5F8_9TRYP|nr:uncharacterized protein TM35_000043980 [Trypanosoma theileri]ORC92184.1 hypothetical protein TM35_000043980 [Trypanosoma theileri]
MTKLVRKLKQMAKKRAHRKTVQKRKMEREQKKIEENEKRKEEELERETDLEMQRLAGGEDLTGANEESTDNTTTTTTTAGRATTDDAELNKKIVRMVGGLVLEAPQKKSKKQMSRKQAKRKEKLQERGLDVAARLDRKWDTKKRRVKIRAQVRNEDLHN